MMKVGGYFFNHPAYYGIDMFMALPYRLFIGIRTEMEMADAPKHTPGPWTYAEEAHPRSPGLFGHLITTEAAHLDGKPGVIAEIHLRGSHPVHINEANARLMAAAPKLLAALKMLLDSGSYIEWGAGCEARAVIAEAEAQ